MAPSPAKRVTRSANAKDSHKRASRKATPADSGYGGSEASWQPSIGTEELDSSEDPLVQRKSPRATTPIIRGISPGKRKSIMKQRKLVTDAYNIRRPPLRGSPCKKHQVGNPVFDDDLDITMRPADKALRSKTPAKISDLKHKYPINSSLNQMHQAEAEMEQALEYFAQPENRSSQQALEAFFNSQPEYPQTDASYKNRYQALRSAAWEWAKKYFSDVSVSSAPLDLMHLLENHPELMEYINSTTSSPHSEVWEQLLQHKRAEIVYSILGKVLEMHVFGKELFGATSQEERLMQAKDYKMRDSD
ncbi:MAG: hypothetical protein Q9211_006371, partial [Gyalolechia sp. 1 TL-2023]